MNNLFSSLSRLAKRQSENFVTEAAVFLLNYLLDHEPQRAQTLLRWLCCESGEDYFAGQSRPVITTQWDTENGRPDIRIVVPAFSFILVEVKQWSNFGPDQIDRYLRILANCTLSRKRLVLLTVFPATYEGQTGVPIRHVRWPEFAEELRKVVPSIPVGQFLVGQFLDFLKEQGMTLEPVGWEYVNGMKSFRHLALMIEKALESAAIPIHQRSASWEAFGWYLDKKTF